MLQVRFQSELQTTNAQAVNQKQKLVIQNKNKPIEKLKDRQVSHELLYKWAVESPNAIMNQRLPSID